MGEMMDHNTDYDTVRERLLAIFDGERATFADRIHIINFIDDMHDENENLKRTAKRRDVQISIMVDKMGELRSENLQLGLRVDKVGKLRLENRVLRKLVAGMQVCEDDDADAHDCPLYDEGEPTRCAYGRYSRIADELGL